MHEHEHCHEHEHGHEHRHTDFIGHDHGYGVRGRHYHGKHGKAAETAAAHEEAIVVTEDGLETRVYLLEGLDCANCAAKMEAAIKKLDGVTDATVSFMTQKMTIEGDDARFDTIVKEAVKVCKKVEPDCEVVVK